MMNIFIYIIFGKNSTFSKMIAKFLIFSPATVSHVYVYTHTYVWW